MGDNVERLERAAYWRFVESVEMFLRDMCGEEKGRGEW